MAKARFISRYGAPSVGVQSLISENYATGKSKVLQRRIDANFQNHLVTDEDFAVALSTFQFPGLPEDFDTNMNIPPRYRVSVWDSEWARENEGWTDEEIDLIIEALRKDSGNGHEFIELTLAPKTAPWPTYDQVGTPEEIAAIVKATGIDPDAVVAYELENLNRAAVINALTSVEDDVDVVVNAG